MEEKVNKGEVKCKISKNNNLDKFEQYDKDINYFNIVIRHLENKKAQFKTKDKIQQADKKINELLSKIKYIKDNIKKLKYNNTTEEKESSYDYCLFIRPDCNYLEKFKIEYFL